MLNYIIADYKRIICRIPRLIVLVIFQLVFFFLVLYKWNQAAGNFNSINLIDNSSTFFANSFLLLIATVDFVQSFSYDFSAKTIQAAIGLGISRLKVILSKLIQISLVIITDILISLFVFGILSAVLGIPLALHQISDVLARAAHTVLLSSCSICLVLPLVFRTHSMIISLFSYLMFVLGLPAWLLRLISRSGPAFLARLQLDRFTHDGFIGKILSNKIIGQFELLPYLGTILYFALGIYLTWICFRKMELDF